MKPTMTWTYTKDHKPTFEECKGNVIIYHIAGWDESVKDADTIDNENEYEFVFDYAPIPDRYIIIDPPIEEPLEYKGRKPEVKFLIELWGVVWSERLENHNFYDPDKAKAIAKWNRFVRGE